MTAARLTTPRSARVDRSALLAVLEALLVAHRQCACTLAAPVHHLTPERQLMLVYFLEYVILPGCAAKVNPESEASKVWAVKHAYVVLSFCYQFGVLISRSSLSVLRISWVELLSALQVRTGRPHTSTHQSAYTNANT